MSMDTSIVGIKPPNEKWVKMKEVWDACEKAGVAIPGDVGEFFGWEEPDAAGVIVSISPDYDAEESMEPNEHGVSYYNGNCESGYEVDLTKLPKDIKKLRFYNSY